MNRIVQILMERDGLSEETAFEALADAQLRIYEGEDAEEVLMDEFGLELDYIDDLI
jgi:hypothetical protein